MPATKRLVLDLPEETVHLIEARAASGEYADAGEVVVAAVSDLPGDEPVRDTPQFRAWLAEGDEIVARIRRGEEPLTSADQVFDDLRADLKRFGAAPSERARPGS